MPAALAMSLVMVLAVVPPALDSLLQARPPDSLVVPLRQFESQHGRSALGGHAAQMLGHLYYARGEYLLAAGAFTRAAARLDPDDKEEARYWAGLSWLAQGELQQARAALEEVAIESAFRRPDARLAIAMVWEAQQRPDRALDELARLVDDDPQEAGPAALERMAILAERLGRTRWADEAKSRLHREYPKSLEAARTPWHGTAPPERPSTLRAVAVQIGVFSSAERAHTLRNAARSAGFGTAEVTVRGQGRNRVHVVRLGVYSSAEEARRVGDRAARELGVTYFLAAPE